MRGRRQHQVIDEGKAQHGGERDEQAHARPAALGVATGGAVFGFELVGETQTQAAGARCMGTRLARRSRHHARSS